MPITETIRAGKRGALDHEKQSTQHTFGTNRENVEMLIAGKVPQGFDSIAEFMDCARAHKRVLVQGTLRPGKEVSEKVSKRGYED